MQFEPDVVHDIAQALSRQAVANFATCLQSVLWQFKKLNCLQVVIILDRQIWPDDFFDVVCLGSFIPEFWIVEPADRRASANKTFGIVGFVAGRSAEEMSKMDESAIVSRTLQQLDDIFGEITLHTLSISSWKEVSSGGHCLGIFQQASPCNGMRGQVDSRRPWKGMYYDKNYVTDFPRLDFSHWRA